MDKHSGLGHRLWKAFVIQAGLISLTAILSVYAARYILSDVLISHALKSEAVHFWERYESRPEFPRPDTYNMRGYLSGVDPVPADIKGLPPGIHTLDKEDTDAYIIHVSERDGQKLYLAFDAKSVSELALLFGTLPLAAVLTIIYLTSWLLYRFSRRAVSPLIQLSRKVDKLDPKNTEHFELDLRDLPKDVDQEIKVLARALSALLQRTEAFVVRERNFTRDVSHELRSPITVIKIAADVLLTDEELSESALKSVKRIQRSAKDMEELIEALLVLARESENKLSMEKVRVNDIVAEEIERASVLFGHKSIAVNLTEEVELTVKGSDKVLSVMIGNLIRNALSYTDEGRVDIKLEDRQLVIEDSGVGISDEQMNQVFKPFFSEEGKQRGGHGVGLTIVKLLSDRFKWPVTIESELNVGTRVTISFPSANSVKLSDLRKETAS